MKKDIQPGIHDGTVIEFKSGVAAGETVLIPAKTEKFGGMDHSGMAGGNP